MKVQDVLHAHNVSKSQFCLDFRLSRPTFNDYIIKYESGQEIPKERYEIVFKQLFDKDLEEKAFNDRYNALVTLMDRDYATQLQDIDIDTTEDIFEIVSLLKKLSQDKDTTSTMYVKTFLKMYASNRICQLWAHYLLMINGLEDVDNLTDNEKSYIGNFYHLNAVYNSSPDLLTPVYFRDFISRRDELIKKKLEREDAYKRAFNDALSDYLKDKMDEYTNLKEEDIKNILKSVANKMKK